MVSGNGRTGQGWVCGGLVVLALFLALAFAPVAVVHAASLSVTTCNGTGTGSLTAAITTANTNADASNTITFAQDCSATPIPFTSGQTISKTLTIDGTGHGVTISGGGTTGLFTVNSGGTLTLTGLTLANGNVLAGGGAIYNNGGTVQVTNSAFTGNSATSTNGGFGGAIYNQGTMRVTNSTFSGNSATNYGGALFNSNGTIQVTNSTFSGNSVTVFNGGYGGAIYNYSGNTIALALSVVAGNGASFGPDIYGAIASGGGNVIGSVNNASGFVASDKQNTDPKLATLVLNAPGTTQTFALLPGSPAIDLAPCPTDPITNATLATDQRGVMRPQGSACDSGSFESRGFTTDTLTGNGQSALVNTAFANRVGLTVSDTNNEPVSGGQVTFTITPGTSSARFPVAGGCNRTSATVAVCPVTMSGIVTSPNFTATLVAGSFTIVATANGASISTFTETVTPGPAATFTVAGFPSPIPSGTASTVTVTAKDAYGNIATGYAGATQITSGDPQAILPANATLSNGVGTFTITLKTAGTQSITATDTTTASITGTQSGITVTSGPAATFTVTGFPASIPSGTAGTVTVTAKDAYGNTARGYTGTVRITSSDSAATLPANATLTNDVGTFTVTLHTLGTQSITATDTTAASIIGTQTGITVIGTAPTANNDGPYSLISGTTLAVSAGQGVLTNDTRGTPPAAITVSTQPVHGAVSVNADGSFTYTSTAGYTGLDSFQYTLTNSVGASTATVSLTVTPMLALPVGPPRASGPGTPYSQTFTATGGTNTGYAYALLMGSALPPGLMLDPTTGTVSGTTPTTPGSYTFTLTVTDSSNTTVNRAYTIVIAVPNARPIPAPTGVVAGMPVVAPPTHTPGATTLSQPARH